jgi:hypothetical protein
LRPAAEVDLEALAAVRGRLSQQHLSNAIAQRCARRLRNRVARPELSLILAYQGVGPVRALCPLAATQGVAQGELLL